MVARDTGGMAGQLRLGQEDTEEEQSGNGCWASLIVSLFVEHRATWDVHLDVGSHSEPVAL